MIVKGTLAINDLLTSCYVEGSLMSRNFNLVGAIHELPLHANQKIRRRLNLFRKTGLTKSLWQFAKTNINYKLLMSNALWFS